MSAKVLSFPPHIQSLLSRFSEAGGCVDHLWIDPGHAIADWKIKHREAVIEATEWLIKESFCPPSSWSPTIDFEKFQSTHPDLVTPAQFMGPRWDSEKRQRILQKQVSGRQVFDWFYGDNYPSEQNILPKSESKLFQRTGYAYAFSDPPYGFGSSGRLVPDFYASIVSTLLPKLWSPNTRVLQWPTNWSTYFDPGNEWWGSFLWTVEQHDFPLLVVAASTTD